MNQAEPKRVGLIVGDEPHFPGALIQEFNQHHQDVQAALVKVGGTFMDERPRYDIIIDRMSHEVPYFRAFLKYAAIQGSYVINNPFVWSADDKFIGTTLANALGLSTPRTVVLPNKHVAKELGPDCFRNLEYPMNWEGIVEYVGVPAIFKDVHSGGRLAAYRVHNVDELIQRYDESGRRTMILQQLIESDTHVHCLVIGQEQVLPLRYSLSDDRYLPDAVSPETPLGRRLTADAIMLSKTYGYDINMVEFVLKGDSPFVINSTNPTPVIDLRLMRQEQFDWCVSETAKMVAERLSVPLPGQTPYEL